MLSEKYNDFQRTNPLLNIKNKKGIATNEIRLRREQIPHLCKKKESIKELKN